MTDPDKGEGTGKVVDGLGCWEIVWLTRRVKLC